MARLEVNRSGEMEVFVRVVELGGFSAAARALRMTPSAVSKLIVRLEARLGIRLLNRSTRQIQVTPEGCLFYQRSLRILSDLNEAESGAANHGPPRGRICINTNVPFGQHVLLPLVPEFLTRYPDVTLDIVLTDEVVDILEKRTDVAVRAGPLKDSRLVARKLGETRLVVVGSPEYLERRGTPLKPSDLEQHNRLNFNYSRSLEGWPFAENGNVTYIPPIGDTQASDGEALRLLALAGVGLARLTVFHVRKDIEAARLIPLLEEFNPGDTEEIHAVFLGQGAYLPLRIRALLDFFVERIGVK